jgi:predicted lipoprotein with Yx(FWY)xxD motif
MKRLAIGFVAALLASAPAWAAEPAKVMETSLGAIFVDADGMTLYTFDRDEPNTSNCYDKCAENWPPLMADANAMADGEWTIVERTDGTKMWAYDGMPLYLFVKDEKPGDMTGDGANEVWHVAKPIED